ncbi:MAG: 16S rRNA (guanine(527)-N(7))-methyltransferase RsmG [Clostridia bacterium]|nr:16S rRNA (guanine(527)-N(7))-methyltransferase RsmG [Clostridia bacterium]
MSDYSNIIEVVFSENGLEGLLNKSVIQKLNSLIDRTVNTNKKFNITAITNEEEIIFKHIADSATVIKFIPQNAKLLDVGTGGGFPALPISIMRPDVSVYALDSTAKKLAYIDETAMALELPNIKTVCGRAEEHGRSVNYRERFDFVTARAVSALNVLTELCLPFVKVGGIFAAMKGLSASDEAELAKSGVVQLGGSKFIDNSFTLTHNGEDLHRHILVSKKIKQTPPSFPRQYSRITKKPL